MGRRNVIPQKRVRFGWKGDRPWVRLESLSGRSLVRSPTITSGKQRFAIERGNPLFTELLAKTSDE